MKAKRHAFIPATVGCGCNGGDGCRVLRPGGQNGNSGLGLRFSPGFSALESLGSEFLGSGQQ
jgi:hypothetical protein